MSDPLSDAPHTAPLDGKQRRLGIGAKASAQLRRGRDRRGGGRAVGSPAVASALRGSARQERQAGVRNVPGVELRIDIYGLEVRVGLVAGNCAPLRADEITLMAARSFEARVVLSRGMAYSPRQLFAADLGRLSNNGPPTGPRAPVAAWLGRSAGNLFAGPPGGGPAQRLDPLRLRQQDDQDDDDRDDDRGDGDRTSVHGALRRSVVNG
jgi:hypothetical protein